MIPLDETKRERRLRFSLIIIIIALVIFVFFLRSNKIETNNEQQQTSPIVAVVQNSDEQNENPSVAVYEYKDGQHVLALYEIQRNNDFFFKTIAAAELKEPPEELIPDSEGKGVWIKISRKWHYFNHALEEEHRAEKTRETVEETDFHTVKNENEMILTIENADYNLGPREKVISVFSLSANENLWLAVTDSELKILH